MQAAIAGIGEVAQGILPNMGDDRNVGNDFGSFAVGIVTAVVAAAIFGILLLLASQFVGL